jgi:hypothetical protein
MIDGGHEAEVTELRVELGGRLVLLGIVKQVVPLVKPHVHIHPAQGEGDGRHQEHSGNELFHGLASRGARVTIDR